MREIFTKSDCDTMDWHLGHLTLPLFIQLFRHKEFQDSLLIGFVYSIGNLTESMVKAAHTSFLKELKLVERESEAEFRVVIEKLLDLCKEHLKCDRLSLSLIKTVDLVVQNGLLSKDGMSDFPQKFLVVCLENVKNTKV